MFRTVCSEPSRTSPIINMSYWIAGLCLLLFSATPVSAGTEQFSTPALGAAQLAPHVAADERYVIIDLRSEVEYRIGHIPTALNIPPDHLDQHVDTLRRADTVVLYCTVGKRTRVAEQHLLAHRLGNLVHLQGGFGSWIRGGYDIEKGVAPTAGPN